MFPEPRRFADIPFFVQAYNRQRLYSTLISPGNMTDVERIAGRINFEGGVAGVDDDDCDVNDKGKTCLKLVL